MANEEKFEIERMYMALITNRSDWAGNFAQMTIKALITANTAVAVAYPTLDKIIPNLALENIIGPVGAALFGVLLAILSGYFSYLNYNAQAQAYSFMMVKELQDLNDLDVDQEIHTSIQKYESQTNVTLILGNLAGIASILFLITSVILFALSVNITPSI